MIGKEGTNAEQMDCWAWCWGREVGLSVLKVVFAMIRNYILGEVPEMVFAFWDFMHV